MIHLITGSIGIGTSVLIIILIRKDQLHVSHGLSWVTIAVGFSLLGFSPALIDWIASALGVAYPPALALTVAVSLIVVKLLLIDIENSKLKLRNQRLAQRIAMHETDLIKLKATALKVPENERVRP